MRFAFRRLKRQSPTMDCPVPPVDDTARLRRRLLLALAAVAGIGILVRFNPATSAFYPFCPLHRLTGLLCPGCGSLRALHELLHGNVLTAFHLNALLVLSLPLLAVFVARGLWRRRRGCRDSFGISGGVYWAGFAVIILFGIFRNF